ncbi:MAG: class I SAM-dependent methyltransferase [Desulfohalobiaceae bacterium]
MREVCPVCLHSEPRLFYSEPGWDYWRCENCLATYLDSSQLPGPGHELQRYCEHNNDPQDPSYRKFLNKLARPLLQRLRPGSRGLDFGCGPGPGLAWILREAGHWVRLYDPFFYPQETLLQQSYDFVACCEVVEHLHQPYQEFCLLRNLLQPGGWLGIMTSFQTQDENFACWRYRQDPTHVVFYKQETFQVLARLLGLECHVPRKNVVLLQRPWEDPKPASLAEP